MSEVGQRVGIPTYVFGPETHMTHICRYALGHEPIPDDKRFPNAPTTLPLLKPNFTRTVSNLK